MTHIKTNIVTPLADRTVRFEKNVFIQIENGIIKNIGSQPPPSDYLDYSNTVCFPGFIDTHVHLSQYRVRGKHSNGLLHWLDNYIFAEERKSKNADYAEKVADDFFNALLANGTTTSVVYTAPFAETCDIAFQKAKDLGVRTVMGQTLMDVNCPDYLCSNTDTAIKQSIDMFEKWNLASPLLEYVFTPRFVPVCSSQLMKEVGTYANANNAFIQTHLSENKGEIDWVADLFPQYASYTEVYEKHNLLGAKSLLGHSIHLSENEMKILADTKSKITHCPDSNFFLHSGAFPLYKILDFGIDFALASDVGAGTSLYMPSIMKMFVYRQEDYHIPLSDALYYATYAGAKVLGKEKQIGSIEVGKEADLSFIKIDDIGSKNIDDILSELIYLSNSNSVFATFIAGIERYKAN